MRSRSWQRRWFDPLKFLMLLLAAQIIGLLLWGLTWPQSPPVELSFVVPQDEVQPWQTVIAKFEKSHPDIQIQLVTDPDLDYTTDQRKAIYTADFQFPRAQYDLVYMDIMWPLQFTESLQDLTPYVEEDNMSLSGFLASELSAGELDGTLYRIPMRADVGLLYYRQDLLQQRGVSLPKTLPELTQAVRLLQPSIGYLWQGSRYEGLVANFVEVLAGFGASWIDPETGKVELDTPMAIEAATLLQDLIQKGISPDEVRTYIEQDSLQRFLEGQTIFLRGWPYFWNQIQNSDLNGKVEIELPFAFTNDPGIGCRGGWGFGIPQNSAHPEEAWEAIKYLTSETAQREFVLASGFLPSRTILFQDPDIVKKYPHMPQMLEYLESSSVFRPVIKDYEAASKILQSALSDILRGQQSVKAAMKQAQTETEDLLQSVSPGG
ncbi:ABC transporter substrate-binding protein [Leptothoe spongobia]|uniref:ABC transporter substrate-binding protein n=1 Tax=Leptothoe spongobia TAU-MAC 1115 TaxID=1967444 RepID=A0A947DEF3_9CYAN|nr:ABC transporter substrate-binding protein [Leptothoe spongobia]MBT9315078.1 ABC transporter substrate-binding protein [Leptothoe spongobia TAU-MAC 1115]